MACQFLPCSYWFLWMWSLNPIFERSTGGWNHRYESIRYFSYRWIIKAPIYWLSSKDFAHSTPNAYRTICSFFVLKTCWSCPNLKILFPSANFASPFLIFVSNTPNTYYEHYGFVVGKFVNSYLENNHVSVFNDMRLHCFFLNGSRQHPIFVI